MGSQIHIYVSYVYNGLGKKWASLGQYFDLKIGLNMGLKDGFKRVKKLVKKLVILIVIMVN